MDTLRMWWCAWRHADRWTLTRVSHAGQLGEVTCGRCGARYLTHREEGGLLHWTVKAERFFAAER